jgi:hypothetical protein
MRFILLRNLTQAGFSTKQDDASLGLGGNESKEEHILGSTEVAFKRRVFQRRFRMNLDLFVISFHHMPQNMTSIIILSFSITKPLVTILAQALNNTPSIVNSTINT